MQASRRAGSGPSALAESISWWTACYVLTSCFEKARWNTEGGLLPADTDLIQKSRCERKEGSKSNRWVKVTREDKEADLLSLSTSSTIQRLKASACCDACGLERACDFGVGNQRSGAHLDGFAAYASGQRGAVLLQEPSKAQFPGEALSWLDHLTSQQWPQANQRYCWSHRTHGQLGMWLTTLDKPVALCKRKVWLPRAAFTCDSRIPSVWGLSGAQTTQLMGLWYRKVLAEPVL